MRVRPTPSAVAVFAALAIAAANPSPAEAFFVPLLPMFQCDSGKARPTRRCRWRASGGAATSGGAGSGMAV